jgi:Skp family chaperone for outer membrane proteins
MSRWFLALPVLVAALAGGLTRPLAQGEPTRIGVFDPEALWKLTEVGKRYNGDLTEARDRLQGEIDRKSTELEDLKDKLRQQQATLSEEKIQQMQRDILNKRTELDRMNEDATKEMKLQLNDVQNRFQAMMDKTIATFGKEKNLLLILNRDIVHYHAPAVDITQDLIAKFNEMHKPPAAPGARTPPRKTPEKPKEPPKNRGGA